jgi:hypothetical protein
VLNGRFDNSLPQDGDVAAEPMFNIWNCQTAPIPACTLERKVPLEGGELRIPAGGKAQTQLNFDMIYAGYLTAKAKTTGRLEVKVFCRELNETGTMEQYTFVRDGEYMGLEMHSAGCLWVEAENLGHEEAMLSLALITSHYPVGVRAKTETSDNGVRFEEFVVPKYEEMIALVKQWHNELPYAKIIGWDLAVDENDDVVLVEINATPPPGLFQAATGPAFGKYILDIFNDADVKSCNKNNGCK